MVPVDCVLVVSDAAYLQPIALIKVRPRFYLMARLIQRAWRARRLLKEKRSEQNKLPNKLKKSLSQLLKAALNKLQD